MQISTTNKSYQSTPLIMCTIDIAYTSSIRNDSFGPKSDSIENAPSIVTKSGEIVQIFCQLFIDCGIDHDDEDSSYSHRMIPLS